MLPQLAKVIEKLQIQLNISDLNIKNNQHAFTRDRSTVSALISTTQSWYNATDNSQSGRKGVHVIFIDFRKAFDLVNHNILLEILASMNVSKSFWLWIKSFLTGRTQQVNLRGILSSIQPCPSGGRNFFWDHFGWELCNRAYYNAIGKLRLMLTLILTPTLTA